MRMARSLPLARLPQEKFVGVPLFATAVNKTEQECVAPAITVAYPIMTAVHVGASPIVATEGHNAICVILLFDTELTSNSTSGTPMPELGLASLYPDTSHNIR